MRIVLKDQANTRRRSRRKRMDKRFRLPENISAVRGVIKGHEKRKEGLSQGTCAYRIIKHCTESKIISQ